MEKIINRCDITIDDYRLILDTENHHDHIIIEDKHGTYRWKESKYTDKNIDSCGGLNNVISLFYDLGYDKNSELYRQLYRNMGVSLNAYWEVFYWEMNNDEAEEYIQKRKIENRKLKIDRLLNIK